MSMDKHLTYEFKIQIFPQIQSKCTSQTWSKPFNPKQSR